MIEHKSYPFWHHSTLRDMYFSKWRTWHFEKMGLETATFEDMYLDYSYFALCFMDLGDLGDSLSETTKENIRMLRTDVPVLCFLPCYEIILLRDFLENGFSNNRKPSAELGGAYFKIVSACGLRFLITAGDTFNLSFIELENKFQAMWSEYEKFLNPNIDQDKFHKSARNILLDEIMTNYLDTEHRETTALVYNYIDLFFKGKIPQILAKMRYYYDKIPEVFETVDLFK